MVGRSPQKFGDKMRGFYGVNRKIDVHLEDVGHSSCQGVFDNAGKITYCDRGKCLAKAHNVPNISHRRISSHLMSITTECVSEHHGRECGQ